MQLSQDTRPYCKNFIRPRAHPSYIVNVTPNALWTQCLNERNVLTFSKATFNKFLRLNV